MGAGLNGAPNPLGDPIEVTIRRLEKAARSPRGNTPVDAEGRETFAEVCSLGATMMRQEAMSAAKLAELMSKLIGGLEMIARGAPSGLPPERYGPWASTVAAGLLRELGGG
jgi:hypothetical protein